MESATSHTRERRLWLSAAAVVLALWTTAGFAGTLVRRLEGTGLLAPAFALGFLGAVAAVVGNAVSRPTAKREIWTTLGIAAAYLMLVVRLGLTPAERSHLFEYGLVAVLIHEALLERRTRGARVRLPAISAVVVGASLGWIDEGVQLLLPNRVYDLRDVGLNALAALAAVSASLALRWARRVLGAEGAGSPAD